MPTSIHLPAELLKAVDRKAKALRISRNQLVVHSSHSGYDLVPNRIRSRFLQCKGGAKFRRCRVTIVRP